MARGEYNYTCYKLLNNIKKIPNIFTDWSKAESLRNSNYPKARVHSQKYNLLGLDEIEQFVKDKLELYASMKHQQEKDIPYCTDEVNQQYGNTIRMLMLQEQLRTLIILVKPMHYNKPMV